jgi:hypothetical protein
MRLHPSRSDGTCRRNHRQRCYQQILAVFRTAAGGIRAKDVCLALGAGVTANDTEGMRTKLKRLVVRQIDRRGLLVRSDSEPRPARRPSGAGRCDRMRRGRASAVEVLMSSWVNR